MIEPSESFLCLDAGNFRKAGNVFSFLEKNPYLYNASGNKRLRHFLLDRFPIPNTSFLFDRNWVSLQIEI